MEEYPNNLIKENEKEKKKKRNIDISSSSKENNNKNKTNLVYSFPSPTLSRERLNDLAKDKTEFYELQQKKILSNVVKEKETPKKAS